MKKINKYTQAFLLGLQNAMAYRVNFFLSLFSTFFIMGMQIFLWTAIFNNSEGERVYGYTWKEMITYVIVAAIIAKLIDTGVKWEISSDIKDGGLSKFIIRPIGYLRFRVFHFLGQKFPQVCVVLVILAICIGTLNNLLDIQLQLGKLFLFLLSVILALVLNLMIAFIVSSSAFWLTEAWAAYMILDVIILIASGGVFPLDLFGETVKRILTLLPFQYTIYFPTNILNGTITGDGIWMGIGLQLVWIFLLNGVNMLVWRIGLKKYVAVGG